MTYNWFSAKPVVDRGSAERAFRPLVDGGLAADAVGPGDGDGDVLTSKGPARVAWTVYSRFRAKPRILRRFLAGAAPSSSSPLHSLGEGEAAVVGLESSSSIISYIMMYGMVDHPPRSGEASVLLRGDENARVPAREHVADYMGCPTIQGHTRLPPKL